MKEAAAEGSEKASEACETTKRKAQRGSRQGIREGLKHARLPSARRVKPRHGRLLRTSRAREAADKGLKKAADAWETTKEVAAEGAEQAAEEGVEIQRRREANKPSTYGGSLRRLPRRVQKWPATHGRSP